MKILGVIIFLSVALSFGCAKKSESELASTVSVEATYSSIDSNIFQSKCVSCHTGAGTQGVDYSSYDGLMNSVTTSGGLAIVPGDSGNSRIWIRTRPGGGMPPTSNGLSQSESDAIKSWIDEGAEP